MGQFKQINVILQEIANDANVHPSIREAMRDTMQTERDTLRDTIQSQPVVEVYVLLCDGTVTDVFTDKAMAEYDLHTCISADLEEGLLHSWSLVTRQLTTTTLK
jgi:hypothetical protein